MKYNLYKLRKEAAEPQVGIFWVYRGQVLVFSQPTSSVAPIGGFKDSIYMHDGYWGQMQKMFPELADKEYFDIPRGRVIGSVNGTFTVNLGRKEAGNAILIARIAQNFSLPRGKVVVQVDEHYNPPAEADMEPT